MEVIYVTFEQLVQILEKERQSATFAKIITETDPRSGYKINHEDGSKFPYSKGQLTKRSEYLINLNVMYSDAMTRELAKEDESYEAGKCWFTHHKFSNGKTAKNIVESKKTGDLYFCFIPDFDQYTYNLFETITGKQVNPKDLAKFKNEFKERVVNFSTCKEVNLIEARVNKKIYRLNK